MNPRIHPNENKLLLTTNEDKLIESSSDSG